MVSKGCMRQMQVIQSIRGIRVIWVLSGSSGASDIIWVLKGTVELLHSPLLKIRCPHRLKIFDLLLGVGQVIDGFPGGVMEWVSFPFDEILWRCPQDSFIQDGFNLIFILIAIWCSDGWWWCWSSKFFR